MNKRLIDLCARARRASIDLVALFHHRDILYYAGVARPAVLLVASTTEEAILLVRRGLPYARQEATVDLIEAMKGFRSLASAVEAFGLSSGVMGVELDLAPATLYRRLRDTFPTWTFVDVTPVVLTQRAIKDETEIALTRQAAAVADAGQQAAMETGAPGVSELAMAAEVEAAIRRAGHDGFQPLRYPEARGGGVLLMSGEHLRVRGGHGLVVTGVGLGPAMPYGPSRRKLKAGDLVVVDIGSTYGGYTADESRTFVVGEATAEQQALFAVARAAEDAVFDALRPGVSVAEVYERAEAAVMQGWPSHFAPGSLVLPGFVGHGLGLELDEPPVLWPREETRLEPGMTLAIEIEVSAPALDLASGAMVKVEDTVLVQEDGVEILTVTPRELIACG